MLRTSFAAARVSNPRYLLASHQPASLLLRFGRDQVSIPLRHCQVERQYNVSWRLPIDLLIAWLIHLHWKVILVALDDAQLILFPFTLSLEARGVLFQLGEYHK